jgi:hypothetical protein
MLTARRPECSYRLRRPVSTLDCQPPLTIAMTRRHWERDGSSGQRAEPRRVGGVCGDPFDCRVLRASAASGEHPDQLAALHAVAGNRCLARTTGFTPSVRSGRRCARARSPRPPPARARHFSIYVGLQCVRVASGLGAAPTASSPADAMSVAPVRFRMSFARVISSDVSQ